MIIILVKKFKWLKWNVENMAMTEIKKIDRIKF